MVLPPVFEGKGNSCEHPNSNNIVNCESIFSFIFIFAYTNIRKWQFRRWSNLLLKLKFQSHPCSVGTYFIHNDSSNGKVCYKTPPSLKEDASWIINQPVWQMLLSNPSVVFSSVENMNRHKACLSPEQQQILKKGICFKRSSHLCPRYDKTQCWNLSSPSLYWWNGKKTKL